MVDSFYNIKISGIKWHINKCKMAVPVLNSAKSWQERKAIFVAVEAGGKVGCGEISPLDGYSPDSFEYCISLLPEALNNLEKSEFYIDRRVDKSAAGSFICDAINRAMEPLNSLLLKTPSVRFGLELALLNLMSNLFDTALSDILNFQSRIDTVAINGLVSSYDKEQMIKQALVLKHKGIKTIKVKLGFKQLSLEEQVNRITALDRASKSSLRLRLDVNGAWSVEEAVFAFNRLKHINIEFIEEPVAKKDLLRLPSLPVSVAADESLVDKSFQTALLKSKKIAVFVIKPPMHGGLITSWKLASAAQNRGIDVVISHLFDGPWALHGYRALAFSLLKQPLASALNVHPGIDCWPDKICIKSVLNGRITRSAVKA